MGYIKWTVTWGSPGPGANMNDILFGGEDGPRQVVRDTVGLVDGVRIMGSESCNARFLFALDLGGRAVESIAVRGNDAYYDFPLISAVTLKTASSAKGLTQLPDLCPENPNIPAYTPQQARARANGPKVDALMHEACPTVKKPPATAAGSGSRALTERGKL